MALEAIHQTHHCVVLELNYASQIVAKNPDFDEQDTTICDECCHAVRRWFDFHVGKDA